MEKFRMQALYFPTSLLMRDDTDGAAVNISIVSRIRESFLEKRKQQKQQKQNIPVSTVKERDCFSDVSIS